MTFAEAVAAIGGVMMVRTATAERRVRHVVASDLMSDVLLVDEEDIMLLTSLASDQVLRTAQIVGATGVVIVNDKPVPASMVGVAGELGLSLATSRLSKYNACVAVHQALQK